MSSLRLNQVTLAAKDMAKSIQFYKALGLTLIVDSAPRYVRFSFPAPQSGAPDTLSLHEVSDNWETPNDWPLIYFEVDDIDAFFKTIKPLGISPIAPPETKPYLWREADIVDPSGNHIRIFHGGENRLNPPWRI